MGWRSGGSSDHLSRRALFAHAAALGSGSIVLGHAWRAEAAPASAPTAPKRGGTLIVAQETDPVSLDPHTNSNFSALQGYEHIYESLTGFDEKTNVTPALAERWAITNAGRTYTFHLRANVKFHNGQTMTADDVKYSIDRVPDPKTASPYASWIAPVKEVRVLDPATVQMHLDAAYPNLLAAFAALRASAIMPRGYAERENLKVKAVGTGPFKLVEYVPQDHITYARHADYWDRPLPYLDGLTFKTLTDETVRLAALRAGQVHYAALSAQGVAQLGHAPGITVMRAPNAWVMSHHINACRKPLDDARVRRALRMAVDTNDVIQKAVYGAGVPSGPIPAGYGDWALDPRTLPYLKADVEGAKRLLAEAGYPNGGFAVEIECSPEYPEFVAASLVVQDALRKVNVTANVQQMEWGAYVRSRDREVATQGREGGQIFASGYTFRPGPDGYLDYYFSARGAYNDGTYHNAKLEALMAQARVTSNHDQRRSLYVEIQRIALDDAPNWWWYTKYNLEALSSRLRGYVQSFTGRRMFLKQTWVAS